MRLNQNMNSLSIYNSYRKNLTANSSALDKLSSGTKINSAKDNPNKIGQSETMRMQLRSLQAAQRNLQDGSSMLQTADSALQEVNNSLTRMKELAVSAADGTKSVDDRKIIQTEIDQLKSNIDDLANNTEFNGVKLLSDPKVFSNEYPDNIDIVVGAMVGEQSRIPTYNISSTVLKDSKGNSIKNIDVVNKENCDKALETINETSKMVSSIRSKYGAIQSRFESGADNLDGNMNVVQKAESNIRDTDIALEMAELARTQILNDTALALMVQSNKLPQEAVQILGKLN